MVPSVLERKHTLNKAELDVSSYTPPAPDSTDSSIIEVTGLEESMSEEMVMLYFENPRSGGGEVKAVERKDQSFVVTFQDPQGKEPISGFLSAFGFCWIYYVNVLEVIIRFLAQ